MAAENKGMSQKISTISVTALLWLGSLALGVFIIFGSLPVLAEEFIGMLPVWGLIDSRVMLDGLYRGSRWVIFVGGSLALMAAFIMGEYHLKHAGKPKSRRLFKWTYGIEIALILFGLFFRLLMISIY
jgi:hypothetical protein